MDFAGTEPWLRTIAFAGIFVGAGALAGWLLNLKPAGSARQLVATAGALAAIPAAIAAPIEDGTALTMLALAAIAGFGVAAAAAAQPLFAAARPPTPAPALPGGLGAPAAPPPATATRVATYEAATEARPAPVSQHTVAIGPNAAVAEIAFLVDYSGDGRPHRLGADTRIGRDSASEFPLEDEGASREHARIKLEDGRFVLYDLGSMNGTRLVRAGRRRKIAAPAPLQDLDTFEIGDARLVFLSVERIGR